VSTLRIYLETTIFNFPFADDAPQYRDETKRLFELIREGKFEPYTSIYTIEEIDLTEDEEKRTKLKAQINDYGVKILQPNDEVKRLAGLYLAEKAVKASYPADALHIAITAVYGLDCIISMNFQHIVRRTTIEEVERINSREGYRRIGIYFPAEVIYDEENG
jgi:predicted nucleic acid-binding protein